MRLELKELQACAPKNVKNRITPALTEKINDILTDPEIREDYRNNVVSYIDVLQEGRWTFTDYINAVKYISYRMQGNNKVVSYSKTFPEKVAEFHRRGTTDYSNFVTGFNQTKLVNAIYERTLIPTHVLNADVYQKAINVQAHLMVSAKSEKVRTDAANSLLNHLRAPETTKLEIDMNVKQEDGINDLRNATLELVKAQKLAIQSGNNTAQDMAHQRVVIEGEVLES